MKVGDSFVCTCGCEQVGVINYIDSVGNICAWVRHPGCDTWQFCNAYSNGILEPHVLTDAESADYMRALLEGEINNDRRG